MIFANCFEVTKRNMNENNESLLSNTLTNYVAKKLLKKFLKKLKKDYKRM